MSRIPALPTLLIGSLLALSAGGLLLRVAR
jgi:hypothetical protein